MKKIYLPLIVCLGFAAASPALGQFLPASAPAPYSSDSRFCRLTDVSVFADRVHIHCALPTALDQQQSGAQGTSFLFYALETNSPMAPSIISLATGAMVADRLVFIRYANRDTDNPAGCGDTDCRRLLEMRLIK